MSDLKVWYFRTRDSSHHCWNKWVRIEAEGSRSVEDRVKEIQDYISKGGRVELRSEQPTPP